jgi:hypothetical protein
MTSHGILPGRGGGSVIKCPSSLNVLKDAYNHSCYRARSYEYNHVVTDSPRANPAPVRRARLGLQHPWGGARPHCPFRDRGAGDLSGESGVKSDRTTTARVFHCPGVRQGASLGPRRSTGHALSLVWRHCWRTSVTKKRKKRVSFI